MKVSLGPIYFYWSKQQIYDFYKKIADSGVDIVYLGEVVCSKRHELSFEDWLGIADELQSAGKEVVLSTLTLLEADSELKRLSRICQNSEYLIEANDFAAISLMSKQQKPFVVGPSVNIYNVSSLRVLTDKGLKRWCFPVELSQETLKDITADKPSNLEVEVFVFGKLPLAYSARCFTARAYNLDKDDCQYKCVEHNQGILLSTKEDESFLIMNGIQTLSSDTFNLINNLKQMQDMGIDIVRISPQIEHTEKVVDIFKDTIENKITMVKAQQQLDTLIVYKQCDGYWHEQSGMQKVALCQD